MSKSEQLEFKKIREEKKVKYSKLQRKRILRRFKQLLKNKEDLKTLDYTEEIITNEVVEEIFEED